MHKLTKFALISTFISGFTLSAVAETGDNNRHGERFMERHFAGLNLSEQQKTEIQKVIDARKDSLDAQTTDATDRLENRKALRDLVLNGQFDEAKAKSLIAEQNSQREAHIIENLRTQNQIYALLTPEQRAQLAKNIEERQNNRDDKNHHGKGKRGDRNGRGA